MAGDISSLSECLLSIIFHSWMKRVCPQVKHSQRRCVPPLLRTRTLLAHLAIDWRRWNVCKHRSTDMVRPSLHHYLGGTLSIMDRLHASQVGMIVDRGHDFPEHIQQSLDAYGKDMWLYRDDMSRETTKALNEYKGETRGSASHAMYRMSVSHRSICMFSFRYLTPRVRITPNDLVGTAYEKPTSLHFICSPSRAATIMSEVNQIHEWRPITIYEPIPVRISTVFCWLHRLFTHVSKQGQMHTCGAPCIG